MTPSKAQNTGDNVLKFLEGEMKEQGIPGIQVAVIQDNKVVLLENLGTSNVSFSIKTSDSTLFSINSIAKIFAATAVMQLMEAGHINIDDPISNHLEGLPDNWGTVTVKQLLSHTSGLPDIEDSDSDGLIGGKGQDSAWVKVRQMPLRFKAGDEFNYNATNYLLIQMLIEKYGECSFEEFVEKNQLRVAGMPRTIFGNSYDVVENKSPTYSFYRFDMNKGDYVKGNKLLEVYEEFPSMLRADAGAFSSAKELAKWIMALEKGKLLKDERSLDLMWEPVRLNNGAYGQFGGFLNAYGLGWPVAKRESHPAVVVIGGGRAALGIYPKDGLAIVILTNLSGVYVHELVDHISKFYLQ